MFELILIASLSPMSPMTAQVQPCVWPNLCRTEAVEVSQVQPCVWPNLCQSQPQPQVAVIRASKQANAGDYTTCVWPNKCS